MAQERTPRFSAVLALLLCSVLSHHTPNALSYPCPPSPYGETVEAPNNSFPVLPDQFVMHVEANILQKRATSEVLEVYDYPNKRAAMSITANNETTTSIFSYDTGERFDLLSDGSCNVRNLSDSSFDVFGFTELRGGGTPTIMKVNDVFRLGDSAQKTFIGETVVRGIPVYHWRTCQAWKVAGVDRAAFVLDYFFSKPEYDTATKASMVPVRAIINGTAVNVDGAGKAMDGTHDFSHVYDFSFFRPGPIEDDSVFEIPRGTVCKERLFNKPLPQLPDQFSLSMEVYVPGMPRPPMTERMLFDYEFSLIQTDRYAPRGRGERFGLTQVTIVEDYQNHVQYVIDSYDGNCSISPMPEGLSTSGVGHGTHISIRHGWELLRYNDRQFVYQGQRTLRDLRVDVWANATGGMVKEIYFLADWPTNGMRQRLQQIDLGLDLSRMYMLVGTYLLNTSTINNTLGPFFGLFGDAVLQNRWQQDENYPPRPPLHQPPDLALGRMYRRRRFWGRSPPWSWDSARRHMAMATEKMISIYNYLPMHMDLSAFDVSMCYKKSAQELYVYLMLDSSSTSVLTTQRYIFMSSTKSAVAKAANISMLRISEVNVWQDIVTTKLNFFFSILEPPPVPGIPPQPSSAQALQNLALAVQSGMDIAIKFPIRTRNIHVVEDSLKSWNSLEELWHKVLPGKLRPVPDAQTRVTDVTDSRNVTETSEVSFSTGYTAGQFGGMAFGMLMLGVLLGVIGVYVALRRFRPDIHLLPYQQSK